MILLGSCDANDALHITIVQPGESKPKTLSTFRPQFTYPIFGDKEQIFGYKGLIIRLRFAAHDLRPHVHISYDDRFETVGDTAAVDLLGALRPFISEGERSSLSKDYAWLYADSIYTLQRHSLNSRSTRKRSKRMTPPRNFYHRERWCIVIDEGPFLVLTVLAI